MNAHTAMDGRVAAALAVALSDADPAADAATLLRYLVRCGLDRLAQPGGGDTLERWQALAVVAEHDLSLAKLYEGHTDAESILTELDDRHGLQAGGTWGVWAAESPHARTTITRRAGGSVVLHGGKSWCSGAQHVDNGLLTAWYGDGSGPQLVRVAMGQTGVRVEGDAWRSVGMAGCAALDVFFDGALAVPVGQPGDYLARPGFWPGGAGVAACWYGGARGIARALYRAVRDVPEPGVFRTAALGKVDLALQSTDAVLRHAARWIDTHPAQDASRVALRARLSAEDCARCVLDEAGRALGAAAFCRDAHFARAAADLPVFVRQSHAERDFAELGIRVHLEAGEPWVL